MGKPFLLLLVSALFLSSAALAEESYKEKQIKKLGGKVTETTNDKGETIRHIEFPSGVTIDESPSGSLGMDNSGHGAVWCSWMIYIEIKNRLEQCSSEKDALAIKIVGKSIDKMEKFIIENSLEHISMAEI